MPGFMPGIHVFFLSLEKQDVDGRNKSGHDELGGNSSTLQCENSY
jgi:hypothetical protein